MFSPKFHWSCLCLFLVIVSLTSALPAAAAPREILVVFRYDDYANFTPLDVDQAVINAFQRHRVPLTIAVIPFTNRFSDPQRTPLTPLKVAILNQALRWGHVEVAQHGYSHEGIVPGPTAENSEFAGRPAEEQLKRIAEGKTALDSVLIRPVRSLVPPWNTYDVSTLTAAQACGLKVFSAADFGSNRPADCTLRFVPCGSPLSALKKSVEAARASNQRVCLVSALLHPQEVKDRFSNGLFTFQELEDILMWVKAQPDVRAVTLSQAARRYKQS